MDIKRLISIGNVKEKQALAFTEIYMDKMKEADFQDALNNYCEQMALNFIEKYHDFLFQDEIKDDLRKYIINIGADKEHSGKRFYEALYKIMYVNKKERKR